MRQLLRVSKNPQTVKIQYFVGADVCIGPKAFSSRRRWPSKSEVG